MEDILFDLYYKQAHRNEELEQTIEELEQTNVRLSHKIEKQNQKIDDMQKEIERLTDLIEIRDDANIDLVEENKELQRKFDDTTNDYKLASYEISVLNKYIDKLTTENNQLKLRNKMLTKIGLNSIYGIHCCKNHCVYTDTDSIKTESEEKTNDDNN